jgi:hypothetical protein
VAWNNAVELQSTLSEGIALVATRGVLLLNNSISGAGEVDAIGIYGGTLDTVIHNNLSGFALDSTQGVADIFLDAQASQNLVVCSSPGASVLNLGSENAVVGCQQPDPPPAASAKVSPRKKSL